MLVKKTRGGLVSMVFVFLLSGLAVWLAAAVVPGMSVNSFWPDAVIAALVIALLNALVRPLLVLLTLPVTIVTLGLFLLVVNAGMLMLADYFLDGLKLTGFLPALLGSIVLSVASGVLTKVFAVAQDD
jgi:putative membrane protein